MRVLFALVLTLVACVPASTPLAWPASPEGACANLERLGCPESRYATDGSSCPTVVRRAQLLVDMNLTCVSRAADVDAVRACGTVRCRD